MKPSAILYHLDTDLKKKNQFTSVCFVVSVFNNFPSRKTQKEHTFVYE